MADPRRATPARGDGRAASTRAARAETFIMLAAAQATILQRAERREDVRCATAMTTVIETKDAPSRRAQGKQIIYGGGWWA